MRVVIRTIYKLYFVFIWCFSVVGQREKKIQLLAAVCFFFFWLESCSGSDSNAGLEGDQEQCSAGVARPSMLFI